MAAVRRTLARHAMFNPGDHVLVAVSGGADSMALLHLLVGLRQELGIQVTAFHLNHRIRGREADADEAAVRRFCRALKVPLVAHREDVARRARRERRSLEQAGREARYQHLEAVRRRLGAGHIATAHTASDHAETVLMRILQGTSPDGLTGIPPVRGPIIRPLLEVSRDQVRAYAAGHRIPFREDSSNRDSRFLRNRIRNRVLPYLRKEVNPGVAEALLRLAESARADRAYLDARVNELLRSRTRPRSLPASLLEEAESVRRRVLHRWMQEKGVKPDSDLIEQVEALFGKKRGASLPLPGGHRLHRDSDGLTLVSSREKTEGVSLTSKLLSTNRFRLPVAVPNDEAYIDADCVAGALQVRFWEAGDRFHPLGAPGSMKLQDFFVNQKVPRHVKHRVPVVADDEKIVWVAGYRIAEPAKITPSTKRVLHLTLRSPPHGRTF